ncbi:hypothetical protein EMCRGX_G023313 [Ephydatia muelleri]
MSRAALFFSRDGAKWKAFVNVGSVLEILDDDKAKSPYERTSCILGRVKKPTEVEAKALAKCFPFAKSKKEGFDPNAECIVADAQAKKKAAFKWKQHSVSVPSDWNETVQQSSDNTGKASPHEVINLNSGSESDNESEVGRIRKDLSHRWSSDKLTLPEGIKFTVRFNDSSRVPLPAIHFKVKDIPSSALIVEEGENPPDLVMFVRETLGGQAETQEKQVVEEVKDGSQLIQKEDDSEFFGLYKALDATSERVLDLIEEPTAMNSAEKRIFSYLITFVSNSRQDDLILFLRFVTGSSVLLGESIWVLLNNSVARSPTEKTCSCTIELPLSYSTYPEFEQELSKVLSIESDWAMDTI